jgi:hypothetical protein
VLESDEKWRAVGALHYRHWLRMKSDNHSGLPAELLISLLDDPSLVTEPWVKAAAIVQDRDVGFSQRSQVVDREFLLRT